MKNIVLTKEEIEVVTTQLAARLDYFDEELAKSKDPARIREIVEYTKPIRTAIDKMYK